MPYDFFTPPTPKNILSTTTFQSQLGLVRDCWKPVVNKWFNQGPGIQLYNFLDAKERGGNYKNRDWTLPDTPLRALELTSLEEMKLVIVGDEPSNDGNVADGLAFSSTLSSNYNRHMYFIGEELRRDIGVIDYGICSLVHWATQGALLLNRTLSVECGRWKSHVGIGWEELTDEVIDMSARDEKPKVFMLWGSRAKALTSRITELGTQHLILTANAPTSWIELDSFSGCSHFSKANEFFRQHAYSFEWSRPNPALTRYDAAQEELRDRFKLPR